MNEKSSGGIFCEMKQEYTAPAGCRIYRSKAGNPLHERRFPTFLLDSRPFTENATHMPLLAMRT
ncbi:MAG: hypothetical protein ABIO19_06975 [Burkholderiaceae bacterium]